MKNRRKIAHNAPSIGRAEVGGVKRVLKRNWLSPGVEVLNFEAELANYLGVNPKSVIAVQSGSAALFLAVSSLASENQEVYVPAYSCNAVKNSVKLVENKLIVVDIPGEGPNIDSSCITNVGGESIVILVSTFGIPGNPQKMDQHQVIEDFSQALGASIGERKIGTLGRLGVVSFSVTKLITTAGMGGAIVCEDESLIQEIRSLCDYDSSFDSNSRFNFKMTDLQAAYGRVQLKNYPKFLEKRQQIFSIYEKIGLPLMRNSTPNSEFVPYRAIIKTADPIVIKQKLKMQGIESILPYTSDELQINQSEFPNSFKLCNSALSLPIYPSLSLRDARRIAEIAYDAIVL